MPKFRGIKFRYVLQSLFGFFCIAGFMFFSNIVFSENILASMGATMFIAMTMPNSAAAKPRFLIGGYCCGSVSGTVSAYTALFYPQIPVPVIAGLAVGLAIFLTVCLNFEHPPACAFALGVAFSKRPLLSVLIMLCCIVFLCIILKLAKKHMANLLN
ncbi:MAG: HPP family protein [Spirochaetaceae bacterium]|jgi:CBS-domain-containing membrane protein|nr:HPP family protein [Spirochaetaceae bacterium]